MDIRFDSICIYIKNYITIHISPTRNFIFTLKIGDQLYFNVLFMIDYPILDLYY